MKIKSSDNLLSDLNVDEFTTVLTMKEKHLKGYRWGFTELIFDNIILNDVNYVNFYKIPSTGEVWCGNLEDYIQYDDIVVELFLIESLDIMMHVIVKKHSKITVVKSIISRIFFEFKEIYIWNGSGVALMDEQTFNEIDENGYYRLIISNNGGDGQFRNCCKSYNQYIVKENNWSFTEEYEGSFGTKVEEQDYFGNICQTIVTNVINNDKITHMVSVPEVFRNSKYLFISRMVSRIWQCDEFQSIHQELLSVKWKSAIKKSNILSSIFGSRKIKFSEKAPSNKINRNGWLFGKLSVAVLNYLEGVHSNGEDHVINVAGASCIGYDTDNTSWTIQAALREICNDYIMFPSELDRWERRKNSFFNYFTLGLDDFSYILGQHFKTVQKSMSVYLKNSQNSASVKTQSSKSIQETKTAIAIQLGVNPEDLMLVNNDERMLGNDQATSHSISSCLVLSKMDAIAIGRTLGEGAFGRVLYCTDKLSKKPFALKIFHDTVNISSFYRELKILSKLFTNIDCPYIVRYNDIYHTANTIAISMEFMSKGSLKSFINRNGALPEDLIAHVSHHVLQAIACLHKLKVIHRDIKADNILLDDKFNAKLADFGLSKDVNLLSEKELMAKLQRYKPGTLNFMPPEILNREPYSEKADIWSFGATVIEMMTGSTPMHKLKPIQAAVFISKQKQIEYSFVGMSNQLKDFFGCCLAPRAYDRPTADELQKSQFILDFRNKHVDIDEIVNGMQF